LHVLRAHQRIAKAALTLRRLVSLHHLRKVRLLLLLRLLYGLRVAQRGTLPARKL
jgi:hypothetical protein